MFTRQLLLLFLSAVTAQHELLVQSRPEILFGKVAVVEGSVVWLYCEVNTMATTLMVFWTKDENVLIEDVPHIRMRNSTSGTSTTFLLVLDNFQTNDSGNYQCVVQNGQDRAHGVIFNLTASTPNSAGNLTVLRNDPDLESRGNRTTAEVGSNVTFSLLVDYKPKGPHASRAPPTATWIKDGFPVSLDAFNSIFSSGILRTSLSIQVKNTSGGNYQCILYDGNSLNYYCTTPIHLDAEPTVSLEAISPPQIILQLPEKLVIKVRAKGTYKQLLWTVNGESITLSSHPLAELTHFYQTLYVGQTTTRNFGVYEVHAGDKTLEFIISQSVPPVVKVTADPHAVMLGDTVLLECLVNQGKNAAIHYTWRNSVKVLGMGMNSTWLIKSVRDTDIDNYTCEVENSLGERGKNNTAVRFGIPPTVSAQLNFTRNKSFAPLDSTQTLTCNIISGDNPISVSWTSPSGTPIQQSGSKGQVRVVFSSPSSYGVYKCEGSNRFGSKMSTIEVKEPGLLFQLHLLNIKDCVKYADMNRQEKLDQISLEISNDLKSRCRCEVDSMTVISDSGFKCFKGSPTSVTYRAYLNRVPGATSLQLINYIAEYVRSGPFLLVDGLLIRVNSRCSVAVHSRRDPECKAEDNNNINAIIGGLVGGAVVTVVVLTVFLCIMCNLNRQGKFRQVSGGINKFRDLSTSLPYKHKASDVPSTSHLRRPASQVSSSGSDNEHYYSVVGSISIPGNDLMSTRDSFKEDFRISQCPIYERISKEDVHEEVSELDVVFTYSNQAYNGVPAPEENYQTLSDRLTKELDACKQLSDSTNKHGSADEDFVIDQCPAYCTNGSDAGSNHAQHDSPIRMNVRSRLPKEANTL